MTIAEALQDRLRNGRCSVGQVLILREEEGFSLRHIDDAAAPDLALFHKPADALEIAKYDDAGCYRPLKSAPNLRHGWLLRFGNVGELRMALDLLYPAAAGAWLWRLEGLLAATPFRQTAERQSGMYEAVKRITNAQADALAGEFCTSEGKCLKIILWKLDADTAITTLPPAKFDPETQEFPLLCAEACNLFVAAARNVVRHPRAA